MSLHPTADVQTNQLGEGTRVWQFCVILDGARIGDDCNICSHCFIESDVIVGNRVTIKCGVQLWNGIRIEDDVFVGPNVTFTNDAHPRSQQYLDVLPLTIVKNGASIGANATILPGLTIGERAMIGAGSVVTSNVPPGTVVVGNPARVLRYDVTAENSQPRIQDATSADSHIEGISWIKLFKAEDVRGKLVVAQWNSDWPFEPKRTFFVHNVPSTRVRGEHAHKQCDQLLLCVTGSVKVVVDDGRLREEYLLQSDARALYVPAGIWATQYQYSSDAVLAVFTSHEYDDADYIRDYGEFLKFRNRL